MTIEQKTVWELRTSLQNIEPTPGNRAAILRAVNDVLGRYGFSTPQNIGGVNQSAKIEKGAKFNVLTYISYLAPSDMSGAVNVCPAASEGCRAACLFNSGRASFDSKVNAARISRTLFYAASRSHFSAVLFREIMTARKKAEKAGAKFAVRINGTSDISPKAFKVYGIDALNFFPDVQFYDYTKVIGRVRAAYGSNYNVTVSWVDGMTLSDMRSILEAGYSVAVPFADLDKNGRIKVAKSARLPETFEGYRVIDGDISDLRYLDREYFEIPNGVGFVVGLRAKRTTKAAESVALESGFFIPV